MAPACSAALLLLSVLSACPCTAAAEWRAVSIEDFGAVGDNKTDSTHAFRAALLAVKAGGGEVLVPANKIYQTAPINLTSNVVLRVEGTMRAVEDRDKASDKQSRSGCLLATTKSAAQLDLPGCF